MQGLNPPMLPTVPIRLDVQSLERIHQLSPSIIKAVHERDDHTCRCCGLRAKKHQQAVLSGPNWRDLNSISTACIFCQQCFHLPSSVLMRSGVLIGFSGVTQAELNRLMVDVYMLRVTSGKAGPARKCLDTLMGMRQAAVAAIGTDDPRHLVRSLQRGDGRGPCSATQATLQNIRLLPLDRRIITTPSEVQFNAFPQILAYWRSPSGLSPDDKTAALFRLERFNQHFS